MSTPTVTETTQRPEPVDHDTFIDELTRTPAAPRPGAVALDGFASSPR